MVTDYIHSVFPLPIYSNGSVSNQRDQVEEAEAEMIEIWEEAV